MAQTTVLEETTESFDTETGEITEQKRRTIKKSKIEPTDEFIKVSKYLSTIFAYNNIPLKLVPLCYLIAERMEWKTNLIYLLKPVKQELADMMGYKSIGAIENDITKLKKYGIIKPLANSGRSGMYEVNSYLFSTGSITETRELQAHFDFDKDLFITSANQKNLLTGESIRKAVRNKKDKSLMEGQLTLEDMGGLTNE